MEVDRESQSPTPIFPFTPDKLSLSSVPSRTGTYSYTGVNRL